MNFFPVYTDLDGATVLLIGQSLHVSQKLEKLLPYGATIRLFSREGFEELQGHPQIQLERRSLTEKDLSPAPAFVVMTDGPREEMERISGLCRSLRIPVNVEDVPDLCTFYFPALITRGAFTLSISTSGKSPAAAALLREQFESQLPDRLEEIMDWSQELRIQIRELLPDPADRRKVLRKAMAQALALNRPMSQEEIDRLLQGN